MVRAAMVNMRPSWPPPRMPSVAPGRMGSAAPVRIGCALFDIGQLHRQHRVGLAAAEVVELGGKPGVIAADQRRGEQRGVGRTRLADGEGRDRDALRHLHDRQQRIHALEVFRRHRHAEHRDDGLGRDHAREVGGAAGAGDDRLEPARLRSGRIFVQQVRRAMRRNDPGLERDAELLQQQRGVLHHLPVAGRPHHHSHLRRVHHADSCNAKAGILPAPHARGRPTMRALPEIAMPASLQTLILLTLSNVFMTFAWYAHLKNMSNQPWMIAAFASWGIALFEYLLQVPANRIGYTVMSLPQLKIMQEVIALSVFMPFAVLYMKVELKWDFLWAALCLMGAVYFMFRSHP